jgi:hypothetical protein
MVEPDNIYILEILPCPIVTGEFAEMRILNGDVVPFVIWLIARNSIMKSSSGLYGEEIWVLWKFHFFMCANEYFDITHNYPC